MILILGNILAFANGNLVLLDKECGNKGLGSYLILSNKYYQVKNLQNESFYF